MDNKPFIKVYIFEGSDLTEEVSMPSWREEEIERANPFNKQDKVLIYRALAFAIKHAFNEDVNELNPHKIITGKPMIDKYRISLSHSGNRYLVAISSHNIGADIIKNSEYVYYNLSDNKDYWSKDEKKIIYEKDQPDLFFKTWARKEALYKCIDPMYPYKENKAKVDSTKYEKFFYDNSLEEGYHFFSICSELIPRGITIEIYTTLDLDK